MGVGSEGQGEAVPPWNFIHGTDVEGGLMVLFFVLVFFVAPLPWEFFCRRPCGRFLYTDSKNDVSSETLLCFRIRVKFKTLLG